MTKPTLAATSVLVKEAAALDRELREQWGAMRKQARVVGGLFQAIMDKQLHRYIPKLGSRKHFRRFEDYISDVTGGIAASTVWVMMRVHGLTIGAYALPSIDVDEMPQQNAYELSKLKPEQRTPEIIRKAKETPINKFQVEIQEIKNDTLPPEKRKPVLVRICEKWPPQLAEMFEETVSDFSLLPVVRDGDRDMTVRHKAIAAIVISARTHACDEIQAAKAGLSSEMKEIRDA